jgi:FkbM family methyltransferase
MDNIVEHKDLIKKFLTLQKTIKPNLSVEIGAHAAEFSRSMVGIADKVLAFEASPFVYGIFYPIHNVDYLNKAVSDKDGLIKFEIQNDVILFTGNNSILNRNEIKDYIYIDVESTTLNSYIDNDKYKNICLWIDCEGANKEVLMGSSNILKNVSSIFIEVEEYEFWKNQWLFKDVNDYLIKNDFVLWKKDQECKNYQYNCIFIKKELESIMSLVINE